MKNANWLIVAAIVVMLVVAIAYSSGYQVGKDIAERENRAAEEQ